MVLILNLIAQGAQMMLVLILAPLLLGYTRKLKARLLRRQGPPVLQPYRDLLRLIRKEAVLAENASWLFRSGPYLIFAATWVAAALVPTFAVQLQFSWTADLIALTALIGSSRFFLALVGMDVGTSFGGIGSSREMMFASLAEPAMIMIVFTLALLAGSTQLSVIAEFMQTHASLRVSLGLALIALIIVALAENARTWGLALAGSGLEAYAIGLISYLGKLAVGGFLLALFETSIAKMRVFRVPDFLGIALMLGLLGMLLLFVSRSF